MCRSEVPGAMDRQLSILKIHQLIAEIKDAELGKARERGLKFLTDLDADKGALAFVRHQIAGHASTQQIVETLKSLADYLASADKPRSASDGNRLTRIAVRKVGGGEDRFALISVDEILYMFSGAATARRLIAAGWDRQTALRPDRIYIRTGKGLFVTQFRSLAEIHQRLDANRFFAIHQSILVNLQKVTEIDLKGKIKQVGVTIPNVGVEWLTVSRRSFRSLQSQLGMPSRF